MSSSVMTLGSAVLLFWTFPISTGSRLDVGGMVHNQKRALVEHRAQENMPMGDVGVAFQGLAAGSQTSSREHGIALHQYGVGAVNSSSVVRDAGAMIHKKRPLVENRVQQHVRLERGQNQAKANEPSAADVGLKPAGDTPVSALIEVAADVETAAISSAAKAFAVIASEVDAKSHQASDVESASISIAANAFSITASEVDAKSRGAAKVATIASEVEAKSREAVACPSKDGVQLGCASECSCGWAQSCYPRNVGNVPRGVCQPSTILLSIISLATWILGFLAVVTSRIWLLQVDDRYEGEFEVEYGEAKDQSPSERERRYGDDFEVEYGEAKDQARERERERERERLETIWSQRELEGEANLTDELYTRDGGDGRERSSTREAFDYPGAQDPSLRCSQYS